MESLLSANAGCMFERRLVAVRLAAEVLPTGRTYFASADASPPGRLCHGHLTQRFHCLRHRVFPASAGVDDPLPLKKQLLRLV